MTLPKIHYPYLRETLIRTIREARKSRHFFVARAAIRKIRAFDREVGGV